MQITQKIRDKAYKIQVIMGNTNTHVLPWQKQFEAFQQLPHHKMVPTTAETNKKKTDRHILYHLV